MRGIARDRYFEPTPDWPTGKIGVITWQERSFEHGVKEGYLPALKQLGRKETETVYVAVPQNVGAVADASAAVSNAVLRFRSAGIDHVQRGMLAVDYSDYMATQDEGIPKNAARERCFAIMRKASVEVTDQATSLTAASACDQVWFIETLLKRASQPTLQGVLQAATRLGSAHRSPLV